jgi:hypothetical protein
MRIGRRYDRIVPTVDHERWDFDLCHGFATIYERIAKIQSAIGARTSAYYGQVGKHNTLIRCGSVVLQPRAELWVYETRD